MPPSYDLPPAAGYAVMVVPLRAAALVALVPVMAIATGIPASIITMVAVALVALPITIGSLVLTAPIKEMVSVALLIIRSSLVLILLMVVVAILSARHRRCTQTRNRNPGSSEQLKDLHVSSSRPEIGLKRNTRCLQYRS